MEEIIFWEQLLYIFATLGIMTIIFVAAFEFILKLLRFFIWICVKR